MAGEDDKPSPDSGLAALVLMLRFLGIAADGAQIRHKLGGTEVGALDIVRSAREFGLKAREHRTNWRRLELVGCHGQRHASWVVRVPPGPPGGETPFAVSPPISPLVA